MKRVSHQGLQLSASQRRRMALNQLVKPAAYKVADAQALNDRFPVFVGPYAPPVIDHDRETRAFWRMANQFEKYGHLVVEESFRGAPFCGDRTPLQQEQTQ